MTVAGKTGTAQARRRPAPHAWFIAFAPAEAPRVRRRGDRRARWQRRQRGHRRAVAGPIAASHAPGRPRRHDRRPARRSRPHAVAAEGLGNVGLTSDDAGRARLLEPLRDRAADRARRHGRRVPRPRPAPRPAGRGQGAVPRVRPRPELRRALPSRGPERGRCSTTPTSSASTTTGQERGTYFIVMEYVEGRSLRDILRAEGRIPAMRDGPDRVRDRRRARLRAPPRRRAPRHQARQRA